MTISLVNTQTVVVVKDPTQEAIPVANCQNAFTARFSNSKIQAVKDMVLKAPQEGTFKVCSSEWDTYSTCCDPTKVVVVA